MRGSSSLSWRPRSHEVPRDPSKKIPWHQACTVRFMWSSYPLVRVSVGSTAFWTASMSAAWQTRACTATRIACCTSYAEWESVHHTGDISEVGPQRIDSTRLRTLPVQPPARALCRHHQRPGRRPADRAIRGEFPDRSPRRVAHWISSALHAPQAMGLGRPRFEIGRLRVKEPKLNIVPLSVDEVARFWSSFRSARDLAPSWA